jgi:hypothetical protein
VDVAGLLAADTAALLVPLAYFLFLGAVQVQGGSAALDLGDDARGRLVLEVSTSERLASHTFFSIRHCSHM